MSRRVSSPRVVYSAQHFTKRILDGTISDAKLILAPIPIVLAIHSLSNIRPL